MKFKYLHIIDKITPSQKYSSKNDKMLKQFTDCLIKRNEFDEIRKGRSDHSVTTVTHRTVSITETCGQNYD